MPGRGLQEIPLRVPAEWDSAWFTKFVREVLSQADVRNAVEGIGIAISGNSSEPATIQASADIAGLLDQPYVLASPSGFLTQERILGGEAGIVSVTDGGAGNDITVGLEEFGVPYSKLVQAPAFSVLGNQLTSTAGVDVITAVNEGDVLWVRDVDGAGTLGLEFSYLRFLDGTAGAPGIAFYDDQDTGLYRIGANNFGMSTGGTLRWDLSTTRVTQNVPLTIVANDGLFVRPINALTTVEGLHVTVQRVGDGADITLGFWEGQVASVDTGFRFFMDGSPAGDAEFSFYRQHAAGAAEVWSVLRETAGIDFIEQARIKQGSVSALGLAFTGDADTGIYASATDSIGIATGGSQRMGIGTASIRGLLPFRGVDGTAGAPSFAIFSDDDTGMYSSGTDALGFSTAGSQRMGIGTASIRGLLPFRGVDGSASAPSFAIFNDSDNGMYLTTTDSLGFSTGGTLRLTISTTQFTGTLPWRGQAGTAGAPSLSFSGDTNTGWFNDVADELAAATGGTERLRISTAAFLATLPWRGQNGSNGAPALSFSGDTNTGIYNVGADNIGVATNGTLRWDISTTAITMTLPQLGAAGSNTAPAYSFSGDPNTGAYNSGGDQFSIAANAVEVARFDANATAGNTRFMIYDVDNATLERVSVGAADSGGTGFKVLRIPN